MIWAALGATAPVPGGFLLAAAGAATALDLVVEIRSARSLRRISALHARLDVPEARPTLPL